jgi:hypothetical protein
LETGEEINNANEGGQFANSVGATSFFRRIKNTIAPNGNEIEISHALYGGANEAAPRS